MAQLIPRITPQQLRDMPDQTAAVINRLVDYINELERSK